MPLLFDDAETVLECEFNIPCDDDDCCGATVFNQSINPFPNVLTYAGVFACVAFGIHQLTSAIVLVLSWQ